MRLLLLILSVLFFSPSILSAYNQPKHEVRAAWITVVYGLDWPKTRATNSLSIEKQKQELIAILDKLQDANFNTVLFQTRMRGEVSYPSSIEPYSKIFTGKDDGNPGYDPLKFAIDECHKRGMECHAWFVSIPLGGRKHVLSLGKNSVTQKKREITLQYKNEYFLNPGHPATKEYLMKMVREVVNKYDIDGVHFDYLRYPEHARNFPDQYDFKKYGRGRTLEQWRRDNITEIVRYIYKETKEAKPWVKVSTCPVGKYCDLPRYSSRGWNAFDAVFQDPQGWLGEGIQDQIYPMMYYKENNFFPFALDWQEQSNGRHVIPGLGIYFLDPKEGNWSLSDINRQMHFTRDHNLAGQGHYRAEYIVKNTQGLYDELVESHYVYPALQPAMTWLDSIAPSSPKNLRLNQQPDGYTLLSWDASTDNDNRNKPQYVVYGSDSFPVDTNNPKNIIAKNVKATTFLYTSVLPWQYYSYFAVSAIDRYGNESLPTQSK